VLLRGGARQVGRVGYGNEDREARQVIAHQGRSSGHGHMTGRFSDHGRVTVRCVRLRP
jgi:hypothetical protein